MIGYAFTLGLLAAVNPCGFPMLPAYLATFVTLPDGAPAPRRVARGLIAGGCLTLGFLTVFLLAGAVVTVGGRLALAWTPWLMVAVGLAICAYGVLALVGRAPRILLPAPAPRPGRGVVAMTTYGVAYAIGSLSCSLPLFIASVSQRFADHGGWAGIGTVLGYGLGMGFFVTGCGVVAALLGARAARRMRPLARVVPTIGAVALVVCGLYLVVYWVTEILAPSATGGVVAAGSTVQSAIAAWLEARSWLIALVAGGIVLGGFIAVAVAESRSAAAAPLDADLGSAS